MMLGKRTVQPPKTGGVEKLLISLQSHAICIIFCAGFFPLNKTKFISNLFGRTSEIEVEAGCT